MNPIKYILRKVVQYALSESDTIWLGWANINLGGKMLLNFTNPQCGVTSVTTDAYGEASISFPTPFPDVPNVAALVEGSDIVLRIVERTTTGFRIKALRAPNHTHTNPDTDTVPAHSHTNPDTATVAAHTHSNPRTDYVEAIAPVDTDIFDVGTTSCPADHPDCVTIVTRPTVAPGATIPAPAAMRRRHVHPQGATGSAGAHSHSQGSTGTAAAHSHSQGATGVAGAGLEPVPDTTLTILWMAMM